MFDVLLARWKQGHRTMRYPAGPPPELPERYVGRPKLDAAKCRKECGHCADVCPTGAVCLDAAAGIQLDTGRCLFCRQCEAACGTGAIEFSRDHRMAASRRNDLVVRGGVEKAAVALDDVSQRLFGRSLKLRQVSAGGCNGCEADAYVLSTVGWDMGRFGIQFVASPRHADGLLITGPVTRNMLLALRKTYEAAPAPKIVIASGACAISGGLYSGVPETCDGVAGALPVDLFVPGCPPHPLTLLDGLLRLIGRITAGHP
jgi:Ni,Fe-hydrogenase III small subunit/formate hydrogenlyase subunit 6/NADH:ubiquinone oxidoreductase subunit I